MTWIKLLPLHWVACVRERQLSTWIGSNLVGVNTFFAWHREGLISFAYHTAVILECMSEANSILFSSFSRNVYVLHIFPDFAVFVDKFTLTIAACVVSLWHETLCTLFLMKFVIGCYEFTVEFFKLCENICI